MVQQIFAILIVYTSMHIDSLLRGYQCRGITEPENIQYIIESFHIGTY